MEEEFGSGRILLRKQKLRGRPSRKGGTRKRSFWERKNLEEVRLRQEELGTTTREEAARRAVANEKSDY